MMNFVLSAEGSRHLNRNLWSTHKIIGTFTTKTKAKAAIPADYDEDDIVILTDLTTGKAERLPIKEKA